MRRFTAYDDNLKPYTILSRPDAETFKGGVTTLITEDGREVKRINRGEYEIATGCKTIRVWSDDPTGP